MPGCAPLRIASEEAEALGDAWATYLDSIPSKKRKAAVEVVERIFPGLVAFGTTAMVFAPRLQLMRNAAAVKPEQRGRTQMRGIVPPFAQPPWQPQQQQPPMQTESVIPPHVADETPFTEMRPDAPPPEGVVRPDTRRSAIDDMSGM